MRPGCRRLGALSGALLLVSLMTGCGAPEPEPPTTGTVTLRFSVSDMARMNIKLVDPLVGSVYGNVYLREDVGATGPHAGAEVIANITLDMVDLQKTDTSEQSWKSGELEPQDYTFLGMYDVDGNSDPADRNPDSGDPVTQPNTNNFEVVAGENVEGIVPFNLIFN